MKKYIRADVIDPSEEDWMTRDNIALDPSTRPATLAALAKDPDWRVRCRVAQNLNCPVDVLVNLADDYVGTVKWAVASNPNTPSDSLGRIAASYLSEGANLLKFDSDWETLWAVANNPNTPTDVLYDILDRIQLDIDSDKEMFRWEKAIYYLIRDNLGMTV